MVFFKIARHFRIIEAAMFAGQAVINDLLLVQIPVSDGSRKKRG